MIILCTVCLFFHKTKTNNNFHSLQGKTRGRIASGARADQDGCGVQARVREDEIPHRRETHVLRGVQGRGQGRMPGFVKNFDYFLLLLNFQVS